MSLFGAISNPWVYRVAAVLLLLDVFIAPGLFGVGGFRKTWLADVRGTAHADRAVFQLIGKEWKRYDWYDPLTQTLRAGHAPTVFEVEYIEMTHSTGRIVPSHVSRRGMLSIRKGDGSSPTSDETAELRTLLANIIVSENHNPRLSSYLAGRAERLQTAPWSTETTLWLAIGNDYLCALLAGAAVVSFFATGIRMGIESHRKLNLPQGHCPNCRYDLRGLSVAGGSTAICPECGKMAASLDIAAPSAS